MASDLVPKMEKQLVNSTPKTEAPNEFHQFMRLPIEMGTQIWEELIPEIHDRIIWVREPGWLKADARRLTSILLRVSPESRKVYLKRFPMALNVYIKIIWLNTNKRSPLQIDWPWPK